MTPIQKVAIFQVLREKVESLETIDELTDFIESLRIAELDEFADEFEFVTLAQWSADILNWEITKKQIEQSQRAA